MNCVFMNRMSTNLLIGVLFLPSTNHEFGFTNSSNADVSTAGLQSSSGQTWLKRQAFDDEFVKLNSWLVEREPRSI